MVLNIYYIAKGIGVSIDIFKLVFIVPAVALISIIPITFNGLGVREAAYVIFFNKLGSVSNPESLSPLPPECIR